MTSFKLWFWEPGITAFSHILLDLLLLFSARVVLGPSYFEPDVNDKLSYEDFGKIAVLM